MLVIVGRYGEKYSVPIRSKDWLLDCIGNYEAQEQEQENE